MDYSQFLHMREELSLVAVLLLLFLADLFMSPDAHKQKGTRPVLNTMLPVILMAIHTAINLFQAQLPTFLAVCITMYPCTRLSNQS